MIFDFISQCSSNYRFDIKYRYLLSLSRKALVGEIEKGFPLLPSGCSISLDRLSSQVILKNVRQAIDNSFLNIVNELKTFPDDVNLSDFIYETQLTVEDIYRNNHYWSEYLYRAGKNITIASEEEKKVLKSFSRFTHIDDVEQINAYKSLVKPGVLSSDEDTNAKRKYTLMLATTLYGDEAAASPKETLKSKFMSSELLINEFLELLTVLEKNAYMSSAEWGHFKNVPLRIHCQYSLSEIFSAFGIIKNSHLYRAREGEYYHSPLHVNLIFMTCKKVEGDYSPSTMYKDYAISTEKIHWQSQNATKQQSKKGMRLIDHHKHGVAHLLFARSTRKDDRSETNPYVFLGEAECYEYNGERPINIVWRLRMPMSMHHFRMFSILD
ncbi:MAG: DUF3427 domain-containing protein [Bacteroidetes bacterium]|nr:MAG: DUF3427 domain-containing protein [Bacteroidota bacterium]